MRLFIENFEKIRTSESNSRRICEDCTRYTVRHQPCLTMDNGLETSHNRGPICHLCELTAYDRNDIEETLHVWRQGDELVDIRYA